MKLGPLSDEELHGLCGILIVGRFAPQARLGLIFLFPLNLGDLKSHGHKTWHVGPLNDEELHGLSGILIFELQRKPPPKNRAVGFLLLYYH